jgi:hypothetical protein
MSQVDKRILDIINKVTKKRPKTVIAHLLKHGFITTEEIKEIYGYHHPPRAIRDVREEGIPIETFKATGSDGRKIGAYKFGDPEQIGKNKSGARKPFSKAFKQGLIERYGSKCAITGEQVDEHYLQIVHRVPDEVAGESIANERHPEQFMLLSGTARRQKSWACEHCENLLGLKNRKKCQSCYWAYPDSYTHIATKEIRRIELVWQETAEVKEYEKMLRESSQAGKTIQDYLKEILQKRHENNSLL